MPNEWRWVAAAYAITWVVLIGYATYVSRRARNARRNDEGSL